MLMTHRQAASHQHLPLHRPQRFRPSAIYPRAASVHRGAHAYTRAPPPPLAPDTRAPPAEYKQSKARQHGVRAGAGGGGAGRGARAPPLHGGAELGDGGGGLRAGGRGRGLQAALPARGVLLPARGRGARTRHQGAQGPHVPLARRLLPRRRPRPPRRAGGRWWGGGRRGAAPALHQVQRLRRAHRGGQVRPRHGRVAPRRRARQAQAALLRQGARPRALLLAAALRPDHKLQMRRAGAGVQLGAPHRRRAVGRHLLQQVGADPERQEAGRHRPHPAEQAGAGAVPRGRDGAALRQAGWAHRGPLAGLRGPRHGVLLLPRQRRSSQEAPAAAEGSPRRGCWHLRARLRAGVADGGEDQGRRRGHRDRGQDRRGRAERQVPGQRDDGRVRGVGGVVAGEDGRRGAGGAAGQERGRRDRRGGGVPGGRPRVRRRQPDARGHGAGERVRAGDQGAAPGPRGVRHGRRRRGRRRAGAARRRRPRPPRHGGAAQGRDRQPPRRARYRAAGRLSAAPRRSSEYSNTYGSMVMATCSSFGLAISDTAA